MERPIGELICAYRAGFVFVFGWCAVSFTLSFILLIILDPSNQSYPVAALTTVFATIGVVSSFPIILFCRRQRTTRGPP